MGISVIPESMSSYSGLSWNLLASTTPNNTVSTYTYSGLSGYKQYKIVARIRPASGDTPIIRINGNTGFTYSSWGGGFNSANTWSPTSSIQQGSLFINNAAATVSGDSDMFVFTINDVADFKDAESSYSNSTSRAYTMNHIVELTGSITSITVAYASASNINTNGKIALYGGN